MLLVTTAPAAITTCSPVIFTPGNIVAPAHIQLFLFIQISLPSKCSLIPNVFYFSNSYPEAINLHSGEIVTLSPILIIP